jgi:hypothetical protein
MTQRFDGSAGTATPGSSRANSCAEHGRRKSQQLRDCQAQGCPMKEAEESMTGQHGFLSLPQARGAKQSVDLHQRRYCV